MKIKNLLFICISFALVEKIYAEQSSNKLSDQQFVDGSAEAYSKKNNSDKIITPKIEIKDGKKYYTWPMWNASKNKKMQAQFKEHLILMLNGGFIWSRIIYALGNCK